MQDVLFENYRVESANDNQIYMELQAENLLKALKSAEHANDAVLKLTKKDALPVLSFAITTQVWLHCG